MIDSFYGNHWLGSNVHLKAYLTKINTYPFKQRRQFFEINANENAFNELSS